MLAQSGWAALRKQLIQLSPAYVLAPPVAVFNTGSSHLPSKFFSVSCPDG
jgi:hypothetical protein